MYFDSLMDLLKKKLQCFCYEIEFITENIIFLKKSCYKTEAQLIIQTNGKYYSHKRIIKDSGNVVMSLCYYCSGGFSDILDLYWNVSK